MNGQQADYQAANCQNTMMMQAVQVKRDDPEQRRGEALRYALQLYVGRQAPASTIVETARELEQYLRGDQA